MKRQELMVAAIKNGTVIDHIPSNKLFQVVRLLHLEDKNVESEVMIGYNLPSKKMGNKSIIKISEKFFTDAELNVLSVVAPNVTLCVIRDYEVVEKKRVTLPHKEIIGIVKCGNPKCITNNEPMSHTLPCNGQQTRHHTVQVLRKRAKAGHDQTRIIHAKQN